MFSPVAAQKLSSLMASKPQHLRRIFIGRLAKNMELSTRNSRYYTDTDGHMSSHGASRVFAKYVNDGSFWQYIVSSSTGCSDSRYFEELYSYYTTEKAWHLCDPNAEQVFMALKKAGVKVAVVSNFDTRLRLLLRALKCDHWFDVVALSAEVEAEKPNPMIFLKACEFLGVQPEDAVHVGDDRRNDIWGARDAGCDAWLWGSDVNSFKENCSKNRRGGVSEVGSFSSHQRWLNSQDHTMGNGCDGGREVSEVTVWLPGKGDDCNAEAASSLYYELFSLYF
ncbi:hypothetical protein CASFOL_042008 [Castilleja foliolosa]|uniref:Haloacid dehalogenase-like hydrolase domain-containing protein 3 n=1 Tax=Castilleja foliolosa TaxID=1961234 RepID=A0ABD3B9J5_9LAMI